MAFEKKSDLDSYICENDAKPIYERETNLAIADRFGTSEASVRRHRRKLRNNTQAQTPPTRTPPTAISPAVQVKGDGYEVSFDKLVSEDPSSPAFDRVFELAGLSQEEYVLDNDTLRFSTWQQGDRQLYSYRGVFRKRDMKQENYVEELLEVLNATPTQDPQTAYQTPTPETYQTPVLCISDCQIGKATERGGGTKETLEVVGNAVKRFIEEYLPSEVAIVVDGGDVIENMFNAPSQPYTNDLDLAAQIRVARRMLLKALTDVAQHCERVIYVSIPSNHGQVRNGKQSQAGSVDADFGLEISYQIEDAVRLSDFKDKISFVRPDSLDETAVVEVSNTKLAFNHGHRMGGPEKHDDWWTKQDHGRMPGWDADILVTAHYHNLSVRQSGNARWIIGVSSPEPGSGYFALSTGKRSMRGLTAFNVSDGMWYDLTVL